MAADLYVVDGHVERVVMTQGQPTFGEVLSDLSDLAEGLGLPPEAIMLHEFWDICAPAEGNHLVGFNCCQFDLPVLIRRSWKLGVAVPLGIRRGRYWGDNITDLRDVWQCGDRQAHGSLDTIAKHLGVGQKNGEGKDFARLWHNNRELALRYLQNDLALTAAIAKRMGVIE